MGDVAGFLGAVDGVELVQAGQYRSLSRFLRDLLLVGVVNFGGAPATANAGHHEEIEPVEAVGPCRPEALSRGPSRSNILESPGGAAQAGIDRDARPMAQFYPGPRPEW